jgi:threonine dehydrogenase-like Zn-dependent dehydrogenase
MNKGLTLKTGQTHMHRYMHMKPLLEKIEAGESIRRSSSTHRLKLDERRQHIRPSATKEDGCIKVVMTP